MKRRKFLKGSAILGASLAIPKILDATSGMYASGSERKIYRILNSDRTNVGTLPILRAFAGDRNDYVSPYVLLDEFGPVDLRAGSDPLRVNAHPHAGVTPTTYFLSGSGHHKDSLNYDFQVGVGEFMMFSSGRGAIHMEETGQALFDNGGRYHGFQIWLNMPSKYKMTDPATYVHKGEMMDEIKEKDYEVKVVMGSLFSASSKIETLSPAFYYHFKMKSGCRLDVPVDPSHNAFIYMTEGELEGEGRRKVSANQLVLYQRGDSVIRLFSKDRSEFLLLGGLPLNETVFSYGPFVMNNEAQIRQCIVNYNSGKMGDPEQVNR